MNTNPRLYKVFGLIYLFLTDVGTGKDIPIADLAVMVADAVGDTGKISWDRTKPDGTPRKLLDVTKARNLGWEAQIELIAGVRASYQWFLQHIDDYRR